MFAGSVGPHRSGYLQSLSEKSCFEKIKKDSRKENKKEIVSF